MKHWLCSAQYDMLNILYTKCSTHSDITEGRKISKMILKLSLQFPTSVIVRSVKTEADRFRGVGLEHVEKY